jgi:hypothetical protein
MSSDKTKKYEGSEHELHAQTLELDGLHHDVGMPAMAEALADMRGTSRRTFLMGAGAAVAGGAALAVGSGALPTLAAASTRRLSHVDAAAFPPSGLKGDLAVAAVATFATTVKGQHQQHAAAWNAVLKSHGKAPVTVTNPTLTPTVQSDFAKVTDITGLAQLALTLETIAAQTYQVETSKLQSSAAIQLSSSIQPVEMQHIAILYYVLGMYPGAQTSSGTPLAFNPTSQAV